MGKRQVTTWIVLTDTMLNERSQTDTEGWYRCVGMKFKLDVQIVIPLKGGCCLGP